MQYFTVQAPTHWEAIDRMKNRYGPTARVLTHRSIRFGGFLGLFQKQGVELTCYIGREQSARDQTAMEEEKKKILESTGKNQTMQLILKELESLKQHLPPENGKTREEHPTIQKIREILALNEFTDSYTERMVGRIRAEFSLDDLNDVEAVKRRVVEWIAEGIKVYRGGAVGRRVAGENGTAGLSASGGAEEGRIVAIVGPTGVGKTTTIAKLAAMFGLENGTASTVQVRMVTIDNYKIAARKQIETYAEIMRIPVSFAESRTDLEKVLNLYRDVDIVLIDTIGKSPNDFVKLGEMRSVLDACGSKSEIHLAISATTKTSDIEEVLRQFEPFGYVSVILTKLDETFRIGNIISVLSEREKPLSYITDGQMVPQDIETAATSRLLAALEGFGIDREELESKFGREVVDKRRGR